MAERARLKVVPADDNKGKLKAMGQEISKLTKEYTKQVKSIGKNYGMILDVKVIVSFTPTDA